MNTNSLSPLLNRVPSPLHHVHLMGVGGTGMASLAGILKARGYRVTGSDIKLYPPMSEVLKELGIEVLEGYSPRNLRRVPDLVVVGNVITRDNPEALELARMNIPYLSFPQSLGEFAMKGKRTVVVAGTHGKTTTTALAAWVLEKAGLDPGFMVGGVPRNFRSNFKLGHGEYFVVEGDEYDTAFFDKGPKFLHYNPYFVILTSIEFDHADIYRDLEHVLSSFRRLIRLIPRDGILIANRDDPLVLRESGNAACPVVTYSLQGLGHVNAVDISCTEKETSLRIINDTPPGGPPLTRTIRTPVYGRHNISNLLAVTALSDSLEIDPAALSHALGTFMGVRRRQEIRGEKNGVLVIDDFAHHPTAVRETLRAVREKFQGRRLLSVFEPRSNSSRRNVFQDTYAASFDRADLVFIPEPPLMEKVPVAERFSSRRLVEDLVKRGLKAFYGRDTTDLLEKILNSCRSGDVVLIMSNGPFDNLPEKLLENL